MPVNFTFRFSGTSLSQIVSSLDRARGSKLVQSLPVDRLANKTLRYLKSIFPVSKGESHNVADFSSRLGEAWQVSVSRDRSLSFVITNLLARSGNQRVAAMLKELDTGSSFREVSLKKGFRFFGNPNFAPNPGTFAETADLNTGPGGGAAGWVRKVEGQIIRRPGRFGHHYVRRTADYVITEIIPELRESINRRIHKP